jgi:mono/diheme cytochrome c family protein
LHNIFYDGTRLAVTDAFNLPDGTVLVQTLTLPAAGAQPARRMETRLLVKQFADWAAYSYLWNTAQTEATLVPAAGTRVPLDDREWLVPSRGDCVACHARGANYALSLTNAQLNREVVHHGVKQNQLEVCVREGLLKVKSGEGRTLPVLTEVPRLVDPYNAEASLADRTKAYFGTNCGHCHMPEGGGNALMNLGAWVGENDRNLINAMPQHGDMGLTDARLITPADVSRSVLPVRVMSRGAGQMPPLGTLQIDPNGLQLLIAWLQSLPPSK